MRPRTQRTHHRARHLIVGLIVLALSLAPVGCSLATQGDEATSGTGVTTQASPPLAVPEEAGADGTEDRDAAVLQAYGVVKGGDASAAEQLLVRTATMRLRVDDITQTLEKIRSLTSQFKGQIDDLQVSSDTDSPIYRPLGAEEVSLDSVPLGAWATLRVPSDRLAEFSKRVAALGAVLRESANQTDVTRQHIDMSARLKNLQAEEVRLRQFLDAAKDVKEMLLVETELSRVRGEIESLQSQLAYLNDQISYGTLTVELVRPEPIVRPEGTDWGFVDAVRDGVRGAAAALRSTITVIIALSPLLVLVLVVALVVRSVLRRRRRHMGTPGGEVESAPASDATGDQERDEAPTRAEPSE